jgi:hypothetical protein
MSHKFSDNSILMRLSYPAHPHFHAALGSFQNLRHERGQHVWHVNRSTVSMYPKLVSALFKGIRHEQIIILRAHLVNRSSDIGLSSSEAEAAHNLAVGGLQLWSFIKVK